MAYSDFKTLKGFQKETNIAYQMQVLFDKPITAIFPSDKLLFDLAEARTYGLLSEKAKSEFIITPILKEVRRNNVDKVTFLSGVALDTQVEKFNGICDYIFSHSPQSIELSAPIFCVVEAKNRTLEEGFAQCAAEIYAAYLFNEENNEPQTRIYGTVSNGYEWSFMKLENRIITIDQDRYAIQKIEELLGVFQTIITYYDE